MNGLAPDLQVTDHPDGAALYQVWLDPETSFCVDRRLVDVFGCVEAAWAARKVALAASAELSAVLRKVEAS